MSVQSVKQNILDKTQGAYALAAAGGGIAAMAGHFAPLTAKEQAKFFPEQVLNAIKQKVQVSRISEVDKIRQEIANGTINISKDAADTFVKNAEQIIAAPERNADDFVQNASDAVKSGFKALISRVEAVGAAAEQVEVHTIKKAAKSSRNLGKFVLAGAAIAFAGKVISNILTDNKAPAVKEKPESEPKDVTMADILLEGLGSGTEILLLTSGK